MTGALTNYSNCCVENKENKGRAGRRNPRKLM